MTKQEKTKRCREILYKYSLNSPISDFNEVKFLQSIFEGHSEWEQKKGSGIDYISTQMTQYNNKCFVIHRMDGSSTDISFTKSITNKSKKSEIKDACRYSIESIIINFRNENVIYGETKCPVTNEILYKNDIHIDHYDLTFNELFNIWIEKYDENFLYSKINRTKDNSIITEFTDNEITNDFILFHNNNTNLRAVTKFGNLSVLKKIMNQR
jgi:hypothetical protein